MISREQKSAPDASDETAPLAVDNRKKILVVEDDPLTVKVLTRTLNSEGYAVYSARNGSEAIGVVRDQNPDMLLVDVSLSADDAFGAAGAWDGFQVTRWLRHVSRKKIPAIIMSAADKPEYRECAEMIGARTFMAKPLCNAMLFHSIEAALAIPT
jgi:CheY-like chemotaxis protein